MLTASAQHHVAAMSARSLVKPWYGVLCPDDPSQCSPYDPVRENIRHVLRISAKVACVRAALEGNKAAQAEWNETFRRCADPQRSATTHSGPLTWAFLCPLLPRGGLGVSSKSGTSHARAAGDPGRWEGYTHRLVQVAFGIQTGATRGYPAPIN